MIAEEDVLTIVVRTFISIIKFVKIREFFPKRIMRIIRTDGTNHASRCVKSPPTLHIGCVNSIRWVHNASVHFGI